MLSGLKQVDDEFVKDCFMRKPNFMAAVWKSVKELDVDRNGFL